MQSWKEAISRTVSNTPKRKVELTKSNYGRCKIATRKLLSEFASGCGFELHEDQLTILTNAVIEHTSKNEAGQLSIRKPSTHLRKITITQRMSTLGTLSNAPKTDENEQRFSLIQRNPLLVIWTTLYVLLFLALKIYQAHKFWGETPALVVARVSAITIHLNVVISIICILRATLSLGRKTFIVNFVPFDDHISIHKFIGKLLFLEGIIHSVAHIVRYGIDDKLGLEIWEYMFTTRAGEGWVGGGAGITGVILLVISIAITFFSMSLFRRKGYFELFFRVHNLSLVYWIVLIFHAKDFWKWFIAPGVIYFYELILRLIRKILNGYDPDFKIADYEILPSKVTKLKITKPDSFNFSPGDYVFINIPGIAKHEWHPFTISSAPETNGYFTLHIRSLGNWTSRLHEAMSFFDACRLISVEQKVHQKISALTRPVMGMNVAEGIANQAIAEDEEVDESQSSRTASPTSSNADDVAVEVEESPEDSPKLPPKETVSDVIEVVPRKNTVLKMGFRLSEKHAKVHIDGPYGTPSSDIFRAKHAILIAAGIGVTPYASILQSIMFRYKKLKETCPNCSHEWMKQDVSAFSKLKKVDFVWVNSDVKAFEWFMCILRSLEKEQESVQREEGDFLTTHLFLKGIFAQKKNLNAAGLKLALDISFEKYKRDVLTGLKSKLHTGAPDWDKIFSLYDSQPFGKPKVFFCGPVGLAKVVMKSAMKYSFGFKKENF